MIQCWHEFSATSDCPPWSRKKIQGKKKHWAINRPCLPPLSHCRTQDTAKPIRSLPAPASGPHLPTPCTGRRRTRTHTYLRTASAIITCWVPSSTVGANQLVPRPSLLPLSLYLLTLPVRFRCCRCLFLPILLPPPQANPSHSSSNSDNTGKTQPYRRRRFQPRLVSETISRLGRSLVFLSRLYSLSLFSSSCSVS